MTPGFEIFRRFPAEHALKFMLPFKAVWRRVHDVPTRTKQSSRHAERLRYLDVVGTGPHLLPTGDEWG